MMWSTTGMDELKKPSSLHLYDLPEGCVAYVISRTSPHDAGRLALVSRVLKSAAESDAIWDQFLPHDYKAFVPESLCHGSKKDLYLRLSDEPLLIDHGEKSFSLDKSSGKKCFMLSSRALVVLGDDQHWRYIALPESRFEDVVELVDICWLELRGRIHLGWLSPKTHYKAYLVFKKARFSYGLGHCPAVVTIGLPGIEICTQTVYLDPEKQPGHRRGTPRHYRATLLTYLRELQAPVPCGENGDKYPKARGDMWFEAELCDFFNEGGEDGELEIRVVEIDGGHWKKGLIVEGIEFRPAEENALAE